MSLIYWLLMNKLDVITYTDVSNIWSLMQLVLFMSAIS